MRFKFLLLIKRCFGRVRTWISCCSKPDNLEDERESPSDAMRDRFVCCLESHGHHARAEAKAAATLNALCCALSPAAFAKPCRGAASVAPLLPKGKVKEGACVVLQQLAARIAVSNLQKYAKKFSEMIKDMSPHYNERSELFGS